MARTRVLQNEFSWSKSRHEKFSECLRAYYLHYYGSWGGWDATAPERARELYVLKKLGNRFTWAGSVVHACVRDVLLDIRAGKGVDADAVVTRARNVMREDFVWSRRKGYRTAKRKDFGGLQEHEYADALPEQAWKDNWATVETALRGFFASPWPELARGLKPEQWLEVDAGFEAGAFQMEGVRVFAIPDFAYVDADGAPVVVDWKTGGAREGYDEQVLGYALYVAERYRFAPERVRTKLVYLNAGTEADVTVDPQALDGFRAHFRRSVDRMRAVLQDVARNTPLPEEHFPQADDLKACARCVFRRDCGRESAAELLAPAAGSAA